MCTRPKQTKAPSQSHRLWSLLEDLAGIVGRALFFFLSSIVEVGIYCVLQASLAFFPFFPFSKELDLR